MPLSKNTRYCAVVAPNLAARRRCLESDRRRTAAPGVRQDPGCGGKCGRGGLAGDVIRCAIRLSARCDGVAGRGEDLADEAIALCRCGADGGMLLVAPDQALIAGRARRPQNVGVRLDDDDLKEEGGRGGEPANCAQEPTTFTQSVGEMASRPHGLVIM